MSESCGGNCSSCSEACSERKPESLQAQPNPKSKIGKVIAVVSGKGGVGKSTVSAMLATAMQRTGRRAGVLDADITGPSIPKAFGVSECASADEEGIYPAVTESGIQIMSVNLLLEHEGTFMTWVVAVGMLYSVLLMLGALSVIHEYTIGKVLWSCLLTLAFMVIILFVCVLLFSLFQQVIGFFEDLYTEIRFRL